MGGEKRKRKAHVAANIIIQHAEPRNGDGESRREFLSVGEDGVDVVV